jgi:hypothetical protein
MRNVLASRTSRIVVIAAIVIGAMSFGAREAFAANAAMSCPYDGWNYLGACTSTPDCQITCDGVHGLGLSVGICKAGCCTCYY